MEDGLIKKTGFGLEHWIVVVKKTGLNKHADILKYLKDQHAFTHGFANLVALKTLKTDAGSFDDEELLLNQYKVKEVLKKIYDDILEIVNTFRNDITISPKKDSVSLIRNKQFVLIKPTTKTRRDLGLKIKGKEPSGRLENSGPLGNMCTHRVRLENNSDLDQEVIDWLKEAYESN